MQVIKASAGSGKTYRLAYEYIRNVIEEPYKYRSILAVTFTNKATDEMKWRILSELNALAQKKEHGYTTMLQKDIPGITPEEIAEKAKQALTLILHDYSRFNVLTIDRFFQKIIRAFIRELGIESDYSIDFDYSYLLNMAIDKMIETMQNDSELRENLDGFIEESLNRNQSYLHLKEELANFAFILFSEEFNETELLKRKETLVEFFSRTEKLYQEASTKYQQRAAEAVAYIAHAGIPIEHFHYGKSGFVHFFYKTAAGIFEDYGKRVQDALNPDASWGKKIPDEVKKDLQPILIELCTFWNQQKAFLITAKEILKYYRSFLLLEDIGHFLNEICAERNVMLLPATTQLLKALIADNDAPFIYEKCGNRYDIFMIDEFQDTSRGQWQNFAPLLKNAMATAKPEQKAVTLVGDIKQSIYRWRGGDWRLLQKDIYNELPADRIKTCLLDTNWRSAWEIVAFNNALIRQIIEQLSDRLDLFLEEQQNKGQLTEEQREELSVMLPNAYETMEQKCARGKNRGFVSIEITDYSLDEHLRRTVMRIEELQSRGCRPKEIALLVRSNAEAEKMAAYIIEYGSQHKGNGYNYDVVSEDALRIEHSEAVRFILCCMMLACNPLNKNNDLTRARYNRFLQRELISELPETEIEFINGLRALPPAEAFERILRFFPECNKEEELAYLQAFHEQVIGFSSRNISDIPLFIEWWKREGIKQNISLPEEQDAIRIQTIHKSKGLEYKAVIIPFVNWSLEPQYNPFIWAETSDSYFSTANGVPIRYSDALASSRFSYAHAKEKVMSYIENINLLYVATTRAERELYMFLPKEIRGGQSAIATCIVNVFETEEENVSVGKERNIPGIATRLNGIFKKSEERYCFGTPVNFSREDGKKIKTNESFLTDYPSEPFDTRIALRFETERYEELFQETLSPRSYGILMHKLFEQIETLDEIDQVMEEMVFNGELTKTTRDLVAEKINKVKENKILTQLFEPGWTVYNERNILLPRKEQRNGILRPDRVIVNGSSARVLDYKFGHEKYHTHTKQVKTYMNLLKQMGYTEIKGYIWYIQSGEIMEIQ